MTHKDPHTTDDAGRLWRSIDELEQRPGFLTRVDNEFATPIGDEGGITRRTFLTLSAAVAGAVALAGCSRPEKRIVPLSIAPENHVDGVAEYYATSLPMGGLAQGVLVRSHEGRPVKLEGNPKHPLSGGATDKWAQASVYALYDPDRLQSPMIDGAAADWKRVDELMVASLREAKLTGRAVRILMESHCSPSLASVLTAFTGSFGDARVVTYQAFGPALKASAARRTQGAPVLPTVHFDKAEVLVAIEDDFLSIVPHAATMIRNFTAARHVEKPGDRMLRTYAIESTMTLTGANSDVRIRVAPSELAKYLVGLIRGVAASRGRDAGAVAGLPSADLPATATGRALLEDLWKRKAVVTAGNHLPEGIHALVAMLNSILAAEDSGALTYHQPHHPVSGDTAELVALHDELNAGRVHTLIIVGSNPVYAAPAGIDMGKAISAATRSFALVDAFNETAAGCHVVGNEASYLESWGDVEPADGMYGVIQPLIQPLYGGRSFGDLLFTWMSQMDGAPAPSWYDHVRNTWKSLHASSGSPLDFDAFWEGVLVQGCLETGHAAPVTAPVNAAAVADLVRSMPKPDGGAFDLVLLPSPQVYDGRFANQGWLQELPDPITKLVWDNAALVSVRTAASLGVETGDLVDIRANGATVRIPALIQPGLAEGVIVTTLGYGRTQCGAVGTGVGANAWPLCSPAGASYVTRCDAMKAGGRVRLAITQDHWSMENRPLAMEGTLKEFNHDPAFIRHKVHVPELESIFTEHDYTGHHWGMSIDLNKCVGCNACTIACQAENNIATVGKEQVLAGREMHWIRLDRYYQGDIEDPEVTFQPVLCQHCKNAPCENVCPVAATTHSPEGLNEMTYNRCVGTRYCSNNCPYKVRRFNFLNYNEHVNQSQALGKNPDVTVRARGVMEKCTFCVQRITEGKNRARQDGRDRVLDGEVVTACMQVCPSKAIVFGDMNDAASQVRAGIVSPRRYRLLEELNVKPSINYLVKLRDVSDGGAI